MLYFIVDHHSKVGEKPPTLIQCWFAGVHINSGGNRKEGREADDFTDQGEIADLTFAWMVELCQPFLAFSPAFINQFRADHAEKLSHPSVGGWGLGRIQDSFEGAMAAAGSRTRAPGQYDAMNRITTKVKEIEANTNEFIHPSVRIRMQKRGKKTFSSDTEQRALMNFKLVLDPDASSDKGLVWVKELDGHKVVLPEWRMRTGPEALEESLVGDPDTLQRIIKCEPLELPPPIPPPGLLVRAHNMLVRTLVGILPHRLHPWDWRS